MSDFLSGYEIRDEELEKFDKKFPHRKKRKEKCN